MTSVLFGKHIDKIEADTKKGVRTMPVLLGEARARRVAQGLMVAYYPIIVGAVLVGWIGPWLFLSCSASPLLATLKVFSKPKPDVAPHSTSAGRSGSSAQAFVHTRRAGALLILGLLLNALLPIKLPWVLRHLPVQL